MPRYVWRCRLPSHRRRQTRDRPPPGPPAHCSRPAAPRRRPLEQAAKIAAGGALCHRLILLSAGPQGPARCGYTGCCRSADRPRMRAGLGGMQNPIRRKALVPDLILEPFQAPNLGRSGSSPGQALRVVPKPARRKKRQESPRQWPKFRSPLPAGSTTACCRSTPRRCSRTASISTSSPSTVRGRFSDRMSGALEFDASEMSSSEFIAAFCLWRLSVRGTGRSFPRGVSGTLISRSTIGAVRSPAGLSPAKRIGVPLYSMTGRDLHSPACCSTICGGAIYRR